VENIYDYESGPLLSSRSHGVARYYALSVFSPPEFGWRYEMGFTLRIRILCPCSFLLFVLTRLTIFSYCLRSPHFLFTLVTYFPISWLSVGVVYYTPTWSGNKDGCLKSITLRIGTVKILHQASSMLSPECLPIFPLILPQAIFCTFNWYVWVQTGEISKPINHPRHQKSPHPPRQMQSGGPA